MTRNTARHVAAHPEPTTGPAHARTLRDHSVMRMIGLGVTAVLAFVSVGGATAALRLTGNIAAVDADAVLGDDRPEKILPDDPNAGAPLNILLLGSDSRGGDNADIVGDGTEGARSDTTMIMHISSDRKRVEMVSIPRDTTVDIPSCPTTKGTETSPMYGVKFNAAFSQGYSGGDDVESGALCTMKSVETLTDVPLDGFLVIDFAGFEKMIDAVGGIELCIPNDIDAPKADHLVLSAGVQDLDGETALKYARARTGKGLGDGSDLGRIGRQQELVASLSREVLSAGMLTDPAKSLKFLNAVTSSMTMSSNFASVQGLAGLAYSARNVRPGTIAFMTAPYATDPNNSANVVFAPEAADVWQNLKHDRPVSDVIEEPEETKDEEGGDEADSSATPVSDDDTDESTDESTDQATDETEDETDEKSEPEPTHTREAGKEAFTGADVTSVCG